MAHHQLQLEAVYSVKSLQQLVDFSVELLRQHPVLRRLEAVRQQLLVLGHLVDRLLVLVLVQRVDLELQPRVDRLWATQIKELVIRLTQLRQIKKELHPTHFWSIISQFRPCLRTRTIRLK